MRREQRRVRWSHGVAGGGRATSWVALTEFIEGEAFVPDLGGEVDRTEYRGTTRMLKFPSGEMPDEEGERLVWCKNEVGDGSPVTAFLDEVFVWRHAPVVPVGMLANGENMTDEEKEITVRALPPASSMVGVDGYDQDVGVASIDGELVVYRSTRQDTSDTLTLEDCRRGAFGTVARSHGVGTMVRFLPDVPVSALAGGITREAWSVPLVHTRRWPREGAARIVSDNHVEVVHYSGVSEEGLVMPQALDADPTIRGRGLFRGRYGTEAMDHDNGAIVVFQPIRYWDRAALRLGPDRANFAGIHEHPATSYITFARTVRDAYWRRLTWSENLDGRLGGTAAGQVGSAPDAGSRRAPSKMDLLVLARFDQGVPWDTTRVADLRGDRALPPDARDNPERYLYLLDDPETANRLDLEASIAEFRVLFTYLTGAYMPVDIVDNPGEFVLENAWKSTPWLRSFTVEYQNRTRVRYAADVR
jgi:hypothetical protein